MNTTLTSNCLGCPGCNGGCTHAVPQQLNAVPGIPDLAEVGKKVTVAVVLLVFGYITYKTFAS